MRLLPVSAALALLLLAAPAADAGWGPPTPLAAVGGQSSAAGLAVTSDDRPAVLLNGRRSRATTLTLRRTDKLGRLGTPVTIATSKNSIEGEGLFAGRAGDLVGGWLEIVNGSRRPVVATGPRLGDRQVLAPGPRSTQFMDIAANRRGDAVVAFWRYTERQYSIYAAYRTAGERFGAPQLLATGFVGDPAVAIDERGAAVVSWTDAASVAVAERPAAAATFGAPVAIASTSRPNGDAGVAIDDGRVLVSWVLAPRSGPNAVLVAERAAATQPFSAPMAISVAGGTTAPRQAPEVVLSGGRALVAWTQRAAGADRAAVANRPQGGRWQAPIVRGAGASVRRVQLLGPAGTRPALLAMTTDHRGLQTATIRDDGTLAPSRRLVVGPGGGWSLFLAHGRARTWLATTRNLGSSRRPRLQAVLYRSTP
jgi:hypothetical protein